MKMPLKSIVVVLCVTCFCCAAAAQGQVVDIAVNTEKAVTTVRGLAGLPPAPGSAQNYAAVLRIAPLAHGHRYEATFTFDAGTEIGYAHTWMNGSPYEKNWESLVGTGTDTGSRELKDKQEKFLFTIDGKSSTNTLYIDMRSNKPFTFRFGVTDRLTGVTPDSRDTWGYFFVKDFDADGFSPFLLK